MTTRDPLDLAADAPLLAAWLDWTRRVEAGELMPMTTPGHKMRQDLTGAVIAGDAPLYGALDTIKNADHLRADAEARAARLWGADWCRFSVAGSTHGNQALCLALGRPGQEVIITRTLHRSLLLGLVLAGLRPVWVRPDIDQGSGLPTAVPVHAVATAVAEHPDACGVILGDPSYIGTTGDVAGHARVAHDAGVPLIVDAAWAAHFGFHPDLPPHAIAAGADAMVTSAHKALPAYTQAALVLARTERLDRARLERAFDATHTTSPAGSIMASTDATRETTSSGCRRSASPTSQTPSGNPAATLPSSRNPSLVFPIPPGPRRVSARVPASSRRSSPSSVSRPTNTSGSSGRRARIPDPCIRPFIVIHPLFLYFNANGRLARVMLNSCG